MTNTEFIEELKKMNIHPTQEQLDKLNQYYDLLIEWNEKINLTAITKKEEVYLKHFYDSLTLNKVVDLDKSLNVCDIGTGAGFPGIVLKIFFPKLNITLVDALNKRINFLNLVIEKLNLQEIQTVHARMEDFSKNNSEKYDIVTARAVAHLSNLAEYSAASLKINGKMIFLKGNLEEELKEAQHAFSLLNLKVNKIEKFKLPIEDSMRTIIEIEKVEKTPKKYPRKFSEIKKNRL